MKFNAFPFLRYVLIFIAGIAAYMFSNFYDSVFLYALILSSLFFLTLKWGRGFWALMSLFFFGFCWTHYQTPNNKPNHYSRFQVEAYQANIVSNAEEKPKTYKVEAIVQAVRQNGQWQKTSGKVLLYFLKTDSPTKPRYGDVCLVKGSPRSIEIPKNPNEFDYNAFLHQKGIENHHFLRKEDFKKIANQPQNLIIDFAIKANLYADSLFVAQIKSPKEYAVANAMVVGLRDDIDNDLLNAYSASGAIHVLSVSGMHVGILYLVLAFCLKFLKKRRFGHFYFATLILSLLWAYAIFTGLSSTVLRATVMCSFVVLADAIHRKHNIYNTLALSAFILLLYNPRWISDVGFQLSYLAIFGIVYIHPMLNQAFSPTNYFSRKLWELSSLSLAAQIATFPLSIYYFHQFPTYFLLANPFVFLFSEGVLPLGLLLLIFGEFPYLSDLIASVLNVCLILLNQSVIWIEKLPVSILTGFSISIPETLLLYLALALSVYFFQSYQVKYLKIAFVAFALLLGFNIFQDYQQTQQHETTIHFIPKQSGISIIKGKSLVFMSDSTLLKNPKTYSFHLKNYYDAKGITQKKFQEIEKNMLAWTTNNKQYLWLRAEQNFQILKPIDILILSNNACQDLNTLPINQIKEIIVDDSNRKNIVQHLQTQAQERSIKFISLYEHGAYQIAED